MWGWNAGMVGVDIFFVISGYLITNLLLLERVKSGDISLKAFYVRRCTRIMPAMFCYIAAVAVLGVLGLTRIAPTEPLKAVSYLCNTTWVQCSAQYGHLWSIGIEEQFYLFWPALLIVLWRCRSPIATCAMILGAICAVIPSLQIHIWLNNGLAVYCLSSGALFALSGTFRKLFEPMRRVPAWILAAVLAILFPCAVTHWNALRPVFLLILPPLVVATVLAKEKTDTAVAGLGEALRQVGLCSYSLYLWHAIATWKPDAYLSTQFWHWSILAMPFAWLSYQYIEKPFIKMGRRWSDRILVETSQRDVVIARTGGQQTRRAREIDTAAVG